MNEILGKIFKNITNQCDKKVIPTKVKSKNEKVVGVLDTF